MPWGRRLERRYTHGGSSPRGLQPPSRARPHHGAAVTGKSEYVTLVLKRNRGWPWPESAFMDSMYGEGGWCHRCGTPLVEQNGPVVLQKRARPVKGAWVPHWAWESFCVDLDLADRIERDLPEVEFLDVQTRSGAVIGRQIAVTACVEPWFARRDLVRRTWARHRRLGARCPDCGTWRWLPLTRERLPRLRIDLMSQTAPVIVSPEWFGDGQNSFRKMLFRRDLADRLAAVGRTDMELEELT